MYSGRLRNRFSFSFAFAIVSLVLALGPTLSAQSFSVLHYFTNASDGLLPVGGLVADGNTMYGTTRVSIFKINADGSGFAVLKHNTNSGGALLGMTSPLVLDGTTLYGTASLGGSNFLGTVFKINTDGTGFTVLKNFTGIPDGRMEWDDQLILSGTTLYGTTTLGGTNDCGTVFKINTDGSGYSILKHFEGTPNGGGPRGRLVLAENTLYGGGWGGSNGSGIIFKINTDGSSYAILRHFPSLLGVAPHGGLTSGGDTIYGTTPGGGSNEAGTVFSIKTDGSDYRVLHHFENNLDGSRPGSGVILVGDTLYGTTFTVAGSDNGTVFCVKTDGSDFATIKSFTTFANANYPTNSDGASPQAGLLASGGALYGTASRGGLYASSIGFGTVFKITLPQRLQIHTQDGGFGFQSNSFGFNISGDSGQTVVIETSTNLNSSDWVPLETNTLSANPFLFRDKSWTNHAMRFYRIRSQ